MFVAIIDHQHFNTREMMNWGAVLAIEATTNGKGKHVCVSYSLELVSAC